MAAPGQEVESLDPQGQRLGGLGAGGVEIDLVAQQQSLNQAAQQVAGGFLGRGPQVVDPDPLAFRHGAGPGREVLLAQALLTLQQHDALQGHGGVEAEHQGFEEG